MRALLLAVLVISTVSQPEDLALQRQTEPPIPLNWDFVHKQRARYTTLVWTRSHSTQHSLVLLAFYWLSCLRSTFTWDSCLPGSQRLQGTGWKDKRVLLLIVLTNSTISNLSRKLIRDSVKNYRFIKNSVLSSQPHTNCAKIKIKLILISPLWIPTGFGLSTRHTDWLSGKTAT